MLKAFKTTTCLLFPYVGKIVGFFGHWAELSLRILVIVAEQPLRKGLCFLKPKVRKVKLW